MILSIDPGKVTTMALVNSETLKLVDAVELKLDYGMDPCQRCNIIDKEINFALSELTLNRKDQIEKILLEVPYSIGASGNPYIYNRQSRNAFDIVKLMSTVFSIYIQLCNFFEEAIEIITIPATYWLGNKETFEYKKKCLYGLVDFDKWDKWKVLKSNDGLTDSMLMCVRYCNDWNLQLRVKNFMNADFSRRKQK
ncbi:MAG: hypothetical protein ACFE95_09880 [Candidatus Hodarchaeota archaeon]